MAFQFSQTGQELQYLADTAEKIAAEYDAAASWTTGDYCTHEGTIYRCTASTTGTFDATKWTAVILCDELEGLRTRMSTAEGNISTAQGDISALNQSLAKSTVRNTETTTSTAAVNKSYTVSGSGLLIVTVSIESDSTSDTGTAQARVYYNENIAATESTRLAVAAAVVVGASATAALAVSNGDVVRCYSACTKNGTKTVYYTLTAMGCTVS